MNAPKFRSNSIETPVFFGSEAGFQIVTTMRLANEAPREVFTVSNPTPCKSTEPQHRVPFIEPITSWIQN